MHRQPWSWFAAVGLSIALGAGLGYLLAEPDDLRAAQHELGGDPWMVVPVQLLAGMLDWSQHVDGIEDLTPEAVEASLARQVDPGAELERLARYRGWVEAWTANVRVDAQLRRDVRAACPGDLTRDPIEVHGCMQRELGRRIGERVELQGWFARGALLAVPFFAAAGVLAVRRMRARTRYSRAS